MTVKFVKYLKTVRRLHLAIDNRPVVYDVRFVGRVPYVTPHKGAEDDFNITNKHLRTYAGEQILTVPDEDTQFMSAMTARFSRLLLSSGTVTKRLWDSVVYDVAKGHRAFRRPFPDVNYSHFTYGLTEANQEHFVVITSGKFYLLVRDNDNVYSSTAFDVPLNPELYGYTQDALDLIKYRRSNSQTLPGGVSMEALVSSTNIQTGVVTWLGNDSYPQDDKVCVELRAIGLDICRFFGLEPPVANAPSTEENDGLDDTPVEEQPTIDEVFDLLEKVEDHLPIEGVRCGETAKYGDYYYFFHGIELRTGEDKGVAMRIDMATPGGRRPGRKEDNRTILALVYDDYAMSRSMKHGVSVIDFTGMSQYDFNKYLRHGRR